MSDVKKEKFVLVPDVRERILIKNGKKFRLKKEVIGRDDHLKKVIYEEFDEKEFNNKRDEIIKYIIGKTNLTIEEVLKNILNASSMEMVDKLHKSIKRGVRPIIKSGCLGIIVGRNVIDVVE